MNKSYIISFTCEKGKENFKNYQIQWGKNKKEALKIALEQDIMKETRCILVSIKRVRQSLVDLILEHNEKVKELKGERDE